MYSYGRSLNHQLQTLSLTAVVKNPFNNVVLEKRIEFDVVALKHDVKENKMKNTCALRRIALPDRARETGNKRAGITGPTALMFPRLPRDGEKKGKKSSLVAAFLSLSRSNVYRAQLPVLQLDKVPREQKRGWRGHLSAAVRRRARRNCTRFSFLLLFLFSSFSRHYSSLPLFHQRL